MSVPVPAAVEPRWSWQRGGALRQRVPSLGLLERAGLILLVLFTLLAIVGPLIVPYDPEQRVAQSFLAPSAAHPFGTDDIGRDEFSRVIVGIRLTWIPGLAIIASGVLFGGLLGLLAGAYGGWTDRIIQRFTDLFLVLPSTLIAIAVVAALGPSLLNTAIAISIFWWPWYSRIVRGEVRAIAARPHVDAARLAGVSETRLLLRHMLPGAVPTILVAATLDVANVILILSMFSFLGLGAPAPAPELGAMTARSLDSLTTAWWLPLAPALVVFLLALAANLSGDGIRDAMEGR
jgi:peptide/nickel transport system permease protein